MRYFFSITVISLLFTSCTSNEAKMELTGTVKGLKKGVLLLQKIQDTVLETIDSVIVDGNSNFSFSEKIESPEIYYLYVRLKNGTLRDDRITFFAENKAMEINTNLRSFGSSAIVTGSKNDSLLKVYEKLKQRYISKNLELIERRLKLKNNHADSLKINLDRQQHTLMSNRYLATINFSLNNKDKEIAPYLILSEAYNANIRYLDTVYKALTPKIKNSKYGKDLKSLIIKRKKVDSIL